ncbi:hypothetical protein Tco_0513754 [Tanacetum coccineum]
MHLMFITRDELCPPNKRYDLMDANKKVDLEHVQCPPESKILTNIIKNHPLRFNIAASSSVPWIYMAQFWHTFEENGTHRTLSAPRSPTPKKDTAESSAPKRSTVIHFRLPERRSTRLTPPALVPTVDKADEMILQDTLQEVIQRGNGLVSVSTDANGVIKVLPPKTAEEILARERERKARTTLLMALPKDHLAKFHKMTYAKEMWEAIKSRFGDNDESKKMQKYILKQQFEGFSVSNLEGLHKGYDRFQSLLSQLEIHGAGSGVDSLSLDDLYNNLRVFESDVKGSTASSFSTQNMTFISKNTSSINDVSTAYGVSNSSGHNSQCENPSSYSFLANQSSCP